MAARFDTTQTQWMSMPWSQPVLDVTYGVWYRHIGTPQTADPTQFQVANTSQGSLYYRMHIWDSGGGSWGHNYFLNSSPNVDIFGSDRLTMDDWYHAAGWFSSGDSAGFFNGAADGSSSGSTIVPASIDEFAIGYENDSTPGDPWNGDLAELWLYRGLATATQIKLIASGISPWDILEHDRLCYVPMYNDFNAYGGWNPGIFTNRSSTGRPWFVKHPPKVMVPTTASNMEYLSNAENLVREMRVTG